MPPPQRPAEKPIEPKEEQERHMGVEDLSDLVMTSGIDLKREEEILAASFQSARSFNSGQSSSNQSNFDLLSSNSFGGIGSRGALSQQSDKSPEEVTYERHKRAAREYNKRHQTHLDNPFLAGHAMRVRMERICHDHGVKMNLEGLYDKKPPDRPTSIEGASMTGVGGNAASILAAKAPSILHRNVPLESILSLLSLATNERLRGLLEDAYGLARGRRVTSSGVVPVEWSDIATSVNGNAEPQQVTAPVTTSITGTSWDAPSETADASQRSKETIAFPPKGTPLAKSLSNLTRAERQAEEARIKKRAARKARKAASANASGDATLTSGLLGEKAPEVKMTKKEREKLAKQDVSEEVATRNANKTAALALGGGASKYSWMTGGAKSTPAKPGGLGASRSGTPGAGGGASAARAGVVGKDGLPTVGSDRKYGVWKEEGAGGKDVQLRDWVNVLETDGRDRKTLCFAMSKLGKEALQD